MHLIIKRKYLTEKSTVGELYVDGIFECFTLEDAVREPDIYHSVLEWKKDRITAIPYGTYRVIINQSTRFKTLLPLLLDVRGFEGVRMHTGNTDADTEGCILVGKSMKNTEILDSKKAFNELFGKLSIAVGKGEEIKITISGKIKVLSPTIIIDNMKRNDYIPIKESLLKRLINKLKGNNDKKSKNRKL